MGCLQRYGDGVLAQPGFGFVVAEEPDVLRCLVRESREAAFSNIIYGLGEISIEAVSFFAV